MRPEKLRLLPDGEDASDRRNALKARVMDLVYHGDHTRLVLQACGETELLMKLPHDAALPQLAPGMQVTVGWDADQCRALPLQ